MLEVELWELKYGRRSVKSGLENDLSLIARNAKEGSTRNELWMMELSQGFQRYPSFSVARAHTHR